MTTRFLTITIKPLTITSHQVFQSKKQDDAITFKLDCLKCDESYTFEVWSVDKEENM